MQTRQQRRAAERAAAKAQRSQQKQAPATEAPSIASTTPEITAPEPTASSVVSPEIGTPEINPISEAQLAANRANALLSTGPTSAIGKATVSQNSVRHGLSAEFRVLPDEDDDEFQQLRTSLHTSYFPITDTGRRLVESVAQHYWLMQRAIRLQDHLLGSPQLDHKAFSLYLRYQTTHERSYYRAMRELANIQKDAGQKENGFASQKRQQEAHDAKVRLANARAAESEIETEVRATMEIPLPGHTKIPFEDLKATFALALRELNHTLEAKLEAAAA